MTQDEIDELYGVRPEDFTALRTKLVAAAKKRKDSDAAKVIAAARRPTTAAWIVNALVRSDDASAGRLRDLAERLRAAHAAMDGDAIRQLSSEQRRLVDELVRTGFAAAELKQPSAALRDDVVGTLQAAIADPAVAQRLGRLTKAERWSGFGEFGEAASVVAFESARKQKTNSAPEPLPAEPSRAEVRAAEKRRAAAAAHVDAAVAAHAEAVEAISERKARLATARRLYEKLLETLSAAEHEVDTAEAELDAAEQAVRAAAERVETANAELAEVSRDLS